MSTAKSTSNDHYFELGKRLMVAPSATEDAVRAAHAAAMEAVVSSGSERLQGTDAVALGEATYLAGQAFGRSLLKYLNEFNGAAVCCDDLDFELVALLKMVSVPLPVVSRLPVRPEDFVDDLHADDPRDIPF